MPTTATDADLAPPAERLPGEPARWFSRLQFFVAAGPGRSVRSAYLADRLHKAPKGPVPAHAPASWKIAAEQWKWRDRAAAWDEVQAERRRKASADALRAEIERHRRNGIQLDQAAFGTAIQVLSLVKKRLDKLTPTEIDTLDLALVPAFVRAAAALALAHLNAEAVALGTADLLTALEP